MKADARKYTGAQKAVVRSRVLTTDKRYSHIICLPGEACKSIENYLRAGAADADTEITVIEKSSNSMRIIKNRFRRFPFKRVNFASPGAVEETTDYGPYDLLDLDTCSSLNGDLLNWLFRQKILSGGEVNLWLTAYRNRRNFRDSLLSGFLGSRQGVSILADMRKNMEDPFQEIDPVCLVTAAGIYSALGRYSCKMQPLYRYCEHVNFMYVYRFTEITPLANPRISLNDIIVPVVTEKEFWYNGNSNKTKLSDESSILTICLKAIQGTTGMKAYAKRQMRQRVVSGQIDGKAPKWIKAGWKSYLTATCEDKQLLKKAHQFVDGV